MLRKFEEIDISRQSCRGDYELKGGKTLKTSVWILSKNSASGLCEHIWEDQVQHSISFLSQIKGAQAFFFNLSLEDLFRNKKLKLI
jgi:hypothetical protein